MDVNTFLKDIKNVKVSTFIDNGILYMSFSGDCSVFDGEKSVNANFTFPKIDISKFYIEKNTKRNQEYNSKLQKLAFPLTSYYTEATISFKLLANEKGELFSAQTEEPDPKEMTVEEIEKELGYKIKIK